LAQAVLADQRAAGLTYAAQSEKLGAHAGTGLSAQASFQVHL
jgi:hypothetical protein